MDRTAVAKELVKVAKVLTAAYGENPNDPYQKAYDLIMSSQQPIRRIGQSWEELESHFARARTQLKGLDTMGSGAIEAPTFLRNILADAQTLSVQVNQLVDVLEKHASQLP